MWPRWSRTCQRARDVKSGAQRRIENRIRDTVIAEKEISNKRYLRVQGGGCYSNLTNEELEEEEVEGARKEEMKYFERTDVYKRVPRTRAVGWVGGCEKGYRDRKRRGRGKPIGTKWVDVSWDIAADWRRKSSMTQLTKPCAQHGAHRWRQCMPMPQCLGRCRGASPLWGPGGTECPSCCGF